VIPRYPETRDPRPISSFGIGGGESIYDVGGTLLNGGTSVEVPTWQALDVRDKPQSRTYELSNLTVYLRIPSTVDELQSEYKPNLPWAENQFRERVSRSPVNPGDTYKEWPWYKGNVEQHKEQGQFSHTYAERYWPKRAGERDDVRLGIRFKYGDLNDVVNLLAREPTTRQAYLPVFFPEDTGAVHGERIPCSLGYLFLMRQTKLNVTYHIRSCDYLRHFRDDIYMTGRLCQWVLERLRVHEKSWHLVSPGLLTMHIGSLHVFEGDLPRLRREYGQS